MSWVSTCLIRFFKKVSRAFNIQSLASWTPESKGPCLVPNWHASWAGLCCTGLDSSGTKP